METPDVTSLARGSGGRAFAILFLRRTDASDADLLPLSAGKARELSPRGDCGHAQISPQGRR